MSTGPKESKAETPSGASPGAALPGLTMAGRKEDSSMRKIKKINGFLVVRFNDREKRNYPDLGSFGVIDAEQYTGDIDFDRDAMEYTDATASRSPWSRPGAWSPSRTSPKSLPSAP